MAKPKLISQESVDAASGLRDTFAWKIEDARRAGFAAGIHRAARVAEEFPVLGDHQATARAIGARIRRVTW